MNIGDNIKKLRKERKITQKKLAESMEISQSYLSDIENGRKNLSYKTMQQLAEKLNVSVAYLTSGNKMLGDLSDEEKKLGISNLKDSILRSKNAKEYLLKENLMSLIQSELSYREVHYLNNVYNFFELEKTNEDNLLFISVLLEQLRKYKESKSKEAFDDLSTEFNDFLKRYINIKG